MYANFNLNYLILKLDADELNLSDKKNSIDAATTSTSIAATFFLLTGNPLSFVLLTETC
jgi:hypothetical protein